MKDKKWYVMHNNGFIISKPFDSLNEAIEFCKTYPNTVVLETVYYS